MPSVIVPIWACIDTSFLSELGHDCSGKAKPQTENLDNETKYFQFFASENLKVLNPMTNTIL